MDHIQRALHQLYENESLTADLDDDTARMLLQWGRAQIIRLGTNAGDQFETHFRSLRKVMLNLNLLVGQHSAATPEQRQAALDRINEYAVALNLQPIDTTRDLQAMTDTSSDLRHLLAVLDGRQGDSSTTPNEDPDT